MGALRSDINGQQDDYRGLTATTPSLSLGLAAGLRRNNLANITTYEIPAMSGLPVTTMVVADRITKRRRRRQRSCCPPAPSRPRLHRRPRRDVVNRSRYTPQTAGDRRRQRLTVRYLDRSTGEVTSGRWSVIADTERRRLVTPDGASAVLFLNGATGARSNTAATSMP